MPRTRNRARGRSPAPPLALVLAVLTALTLLGAADAFTAPVAWPTAAGEPDRATAAVVRRFYAAVNDALLGDGAALASVVAVDVVAHGPTGEVVGGRAALERRFARLGSAVPDLHFTVAELAAEGDRVAARVAARSTRRSPVAGVPIGDFPVVWEGSEFFRIASGTVVEYWAAPFDLAQARTLPQVVLPAWTEATLVSLARFAFPPGAALPPLAGPGPQLLIVEAGRPAIALDGTATIARAGEDETGWRATSGGGETIGLRPGDMLLVPAGVRHAVRNEETAPALILGLGVFPHAALVGTEHNPTPDVPLIVAAYNPGRLGRRVEWPRGVVVEVLTSLVVAGWDNATTALQVGRGRLAPGERIPPHRVAGLEVIAVEAGILSLDDPRADALGDDSLASRGLLTAGDALAGRAAAGGARNAGADPLDLVIVTIAPQAGPAGHAGLG